MKVNEIYGPTIQGEGKSIGKPVIFLRLATCNLACVWCDTPWTWNWQGTKFQHPEKYRKKDEVHEMSITEVIGRLNSYGIKNLVISGGEPMLQQKEITEMLWLLKNRDWWIEIETNGTITPNDEFLELIDQINCSPKLSNSGPDNRLQMREKPEALKKLANCSKTIFKFVVQNKQDMVEVLDLIKRYDMKNIYLMPEGRTKQEQEQRQLEVEQLAKEQGFNFSPRLHILLHGSKRKV